MYVAQSKMDTGLSQHLLDLSLEGEWIVPRAVVMHDLAISVDEELGKVPGDLGRGLVFRGVEWGVHAQELEERVSTRPVHVDLGEHGEFTTVGSLDEAFDFCV